MVDKGDLPVIHLMAERKNLIPLVCQLNVFHPDGCILHCCVIDSSGGSIPGCGTSGCGASDASIPGGSGTLCLSSAGALRLGLSLFAPGCGLCRASCARKYGEH